MLFPPPIKIENAVTHSRVRHLPIRLQAVTAVLVNVDPQSLPWEVPKRRRQRSPNFRHRVREPRIELKLELMRRPARPALNIADHWPWVKIRSDRTRHPSDHVRSSRNITHRNPALNADRLNRAGVTRAHERVIKPLIRRCARHRLRKKHLLTNQVNDVTANPRRLGVARR